MARLQAAISMLNGWIGNLRHALFRLHATLGRYRCLVIAGLVSGLAAGLWAIIIAPAAASFAIAVAAAAAWCRWLEKHRTRSSPS